LLRSVRSVTGIGARSSHLESKVPPPKGDAMTMRSIVRVLVPIVALAVAATHGTRAEERIKSVCWDGEGGEPECETFAVFKATCAAVENQNQVCRNVLVSKQPGSASAALFPANTKYISVKLTRAERTAWQKAKASLGY
jgi:hypothetical protein